MVCWLTCGSEHHQCLLASTTAKGLCTGNSAPGLQTLDDFLTLGRLPRTLLTHADLDLCPNITEPASEDLLRIPKEVKMLMLIGAPSATPVHPRACLSKSSSHGPQRPCWWGCCQ